MKCSYCGKEGVHGRGLCGCCYARYLKYGDPAKRKVKKHSECSHCGKVGFIKALGYCSACYGRYKKNGTPERVKIKKRAPCGFCGEEKEIRSHGLCANCYSRKLKNGTPEYQRVRHICEVEGCDSIVVSHNLCGKHYSRWKRHGHTKQTRPVGWGSKEKHPLKYTYDHYVRRNNRYEVCEEWKNDFWVFVKDIGERPSKDHRIKRIDEKLPLSKINFVWELPLISNPNTKSTKETRAKYAKEYRKLNERKVRSSSLKKSFGITLDQYESMAEKQKYRCAICGEEEKTVNSFNGKKNNLSVDHCHSTGKIRGLLCSRCNTAIGYFNDSIPVIEKAIRYIKYHEKRETEINHIYMEQKQLSL